jgi:predicted ATPase/class 3 adenylate cyclase
MNRPEGTVTLLFTDIEGSTKLWEAHPVQMQAALARHDALLRHTIGATNGYIFKTIGDAFCAAFATATDALTATLSAQLMLLAEPWPQETPLRVRMALHTGAVESRDDDYFGPPLNRAARLLSIAYGGQCLLSQSAYELVRDFLPPACTLEALGEHRLKDLGRPESVFQLCHPGLPSEFLPLRSLDNPELRHNLPQQVTSFVGREAQLTEVKSLLQKTRLLTLTGSGGCGKTRLALQVAADLLDGDGACVWLVELAPLTDPQLLDLSVAGVLGLKEERGKPILQTLIEYLRNKHLLLVLDNCEHLLDACATLTNSLIRQCPQLRVLATSREGLGISGELTYRVPSLSLPDPRRAQTPESLSHYEAVQLFIERAQFYLPSFAVTNANAPAVASICHRLDGIPLAIELAAARMRSMPVDQLAARLADRFHILTGGSRTSLPRQQTLRALIDWSYDLLETNLKTLLCRLSLFVGGCTLEAVESICVGTEIESWEVLDLLTALCDKSLVVYEAPQGEARYRLLETIRQYAADRLSESGTREVFRDRHLAYYLALVEKEEPRLWAADQHLWLDQLEAEHDNLRVALDWSGETEHGAESGLRVAGAIWWFWMIRGYFSEGRQRLARVLAAGVGSLPAARAKALNGAGALAFGQGDYVSARTFHEESLTLKRAEGDLWGVAAALNDLGIITCCQGDLAAARELNQESLAIKRQLGDVQGIAYSLLSLALVAREQGDLAVARELYEEALAIRRQLGNQRGIAEALSGLANIVCDLGDEAMARVLNREGLQLYTELGDRVGIAIMLEGQAALTSPLDSARLWGSAQRLREEVMVPLLPWEKTRQRRQVATVRVAAGVVAFDAAWAEGRALTVEQAIELAREKPELGE